MADEVARGPRDSAEWHPSKYALWSERWGDAANAPTSILLRHPTAPFLRTVPAIDDSQYAAPWEMNTSKRWRAIPISIRPSICRQCSQTNSRDFFKRRFSGFIRWLPLGWPPANPDALDAGNPFVSFRVERKSRAGAVVDETVILVASEWIPDHAPDADANTDPDHPPSGHFLGSGFGIRVVAHVRPKNGKYEIRITGMTASLPFGPYSTDRSIQFVREGREGQRNNTFAPIFETDRLSQVKAEMSGQLGLKNQSVSIRGARIATAPDGTPRVQWQATSKPETEGGRTRTTPYSFVFSGTPKRLGLLSARLSSSPMR